MARPKTIKGVVTTIYLLEEQKQRLELIAAQRGISVSEYLRALVAQHLAQLDGSEPPADPPAQERPNPNRMLALEELREFESSLDRLEEDVSNLEEKVRWQREGLNARVEYEDLERLRKAWHAKKRWLYSFSHFLDPQDVMPAVQRLIRLKERMEKAYEESRRLEEERWSRRREGGQGGYVVIRR
jgi:DNA repair exonuclease SbcCD ATPase subunit